MPSDDAPTRFVDGGGERQHGATTTGIALYRFISAAASTNAAASKIASPHPRAWSIRGRSSVTDCVAKATGSTGSTPSQRHHDLRTDRSRMPKHQFGNPVEAVYMGVCAKVSTRFTFRPIDWGYHDVTACRGGKFLLWPVSCFSGTQIEHRSLKFMKLLARIVTSSTLALAALDAHAGTVTIDAFSNGWYTNSPNYSHIPGNSNTLTGFYAGGEFRSFYAFQLPAVPAGETILSASMTFFGRNGSSAGQIAQKHLGLFDYVGSIGDAVRGTGLESAIFADLGSGKSYGSVLVASKNNGEELPSFSVQLTGDAIADLLNFSATPARQFVIGAALQEQFVNRDEYLWGVSGLFSAASLTLVTGQAVPEPDSLALLGAAALAFGFVARRRKAG